MTQAHTTPDLTGGFTDPAPEAARAFRQIMEAMARPGQIQKIAGIVPPAPLSPAAGAVLLTLCDSDTPVYLAGEADRPEVRAWLAFHTSAPLTGPGHCAFALGTWEALAPLTHYPLGSAAYPDRSATLIVERDTLDNSGSTLRGPGIRDSIALNLPDVSELRELIPFPQGLDLILTCDTRLAALPRSTEVTPCM